MWEFVGLVLVLWLLLLGKEVLGTVLYNSRHTLWNFERGNAEQATDLDQERLRALTAELEQLGFEQLGDVLTSHGPDPRWPTKGPVETRTAGVGRIMAHPDHGCYASLISGRAVSTPKKGKGAKP